MDTVKFFEERNRMCRFYDDCNKCPAKEKECECYDITTMNYDSIVHIVEEWSAAHPRKTRQSVFLEQWPEASIYANGALSICPNTVCAYRCRKGSKCVEEFRTCDDCCREFWMQEVE